MDVEGGRLLSMKTMRMWRKRIPIIFCCEKSKKNFRRTIQMAVLVTRYDKSGKLVETKSKQSVLVKESRNYI